MATTGNFRNQGYHVTGRNMSSFISEERHTGQHQYTSSLYRSNSREHVGITRNVHNKSERNWESVGSYHELVDVGSSDEDMYYEEDIPIKKTSFHVTVQSYQDASHHFLVPRSSEQADNNDIRVEVTSFPGKTNQLTSTCHIPDASKRREIEKRLQKERQSRDSFVNIRFSQAMRPSGYSEAVSVSDGPPSLEKSVVSFCDFEGKTRYKESVNIGPGLSPTWFRSRIVCHGTTTKKNYKTSVDYVPKMKPLKFESTQFVRPKHLSHSFVSYLDYKANDDERWYTTSVHFMSGSNLCNTVHNVQVRKRASSVSSEEEGESEVFSSDGDDHTREATINDLNERISLHRYKQPPLLISSAPERDGDDTIHQPVRMSHTTKMVVKSGHGQHISGEDYLVYLGGYASTGDIITNALSVDGDDDKGYLSDDLTLDSIA